MKRGFPGKTSDLHNYFLTVLAYMILNAGRLMIDPANIAILTTLLGDEVTPDSWRYLYKIWAQGRKFRTGDLTDQMKTMKIRIQNHLTLIYGDIPASKWNDTDRSTFNRKKGSRANPTKPSTPITEEVVVSYKNLKGCEIEFNFEASGEGGYSSLPEDTYIEVAWCVVDEHLDEDESDTSSGVKKIMPEDPNECNHSDLFSRAISVHKTDTKHRGRKMVGFARYINPKYKHFAGPWSERFEAFII